jgi:hypothetical protein
MPRLNSTSAETEPLGSKPGARTRRNRPGVQGEYLGEIECGWHAPTIPTAKRIADALEVAIKDCEWTLPPTCHGLRHHERSGSGSSR